MPDPGKFIWVKRIGRRWVLNAQVLMGVTFYAALALLVLALNGTSQSPVASSCF